MAILFRSLIYPELNKIFSAQTPAPQTLYQKFISLFYNIFYGYQPGSAQQLCYLREEAVSALNSSSSQNALIRYSEAFKARAFTVLLQAPQEARIGALIAASLKDSTIPLNSDQYQIALATIDSRFGTNPFPYVKTALTIGAVAAFALACLAPTLHILPPWPLKELIENSSNMALSRSMDQPLQHPFWPFDAIGLYRSQLGNVLSSTVTTMQCVVLNDIIPQIQITTSIGLKTLTLIAACLFGIKVVPHLTRARITVLDRVKQQIRFAHHSDSSLMDPPLILDRSVSNYVSAPLPDSVQRKEGNCVEATALSKELGDDKNFLDSDSSLMQSPLNLDGSVSNHVSAHLPGSVQGKEGDCVEATALSKELGDDKHFLLSYLDEQVPFQKISRLNQLIKLIKSKRYIDIVFDFFNLLNDSQFLLRNIKTELNPSWQLHESAIDLRETLLKYIRLRRKRLISGESEIVKLAQLIDPASVNNGEKLDSNTSEQELMTWICFELMNIWKILAPEIRKWDLEYQEICQLKQDVESFTEESFNRFIAQVIQSNSSTSINRQMIRAALEESRKRLQQELIDEEEVNKAPQRRQVKVAPDLLSTPKKKDAASTKNENSAARAANSMKAATAQNKSVKQIHAVSRRSQPGIDLDKPEGFKFVRGAQEVNSKAFTINNLAPLVMHSRVQRWWNLSPSFLDEVRAFSDLTTLVEDQPRKRYASMNNQQIREQILCHCIPGLEVLLSNAWFVKKYAQTTQTGMVLVASLQDKQYCYDGVVSVGVNQGVIYHAFFHHLDQLIKVPQDFRQVLDASKRVQQEPVEGQLNSVITSKDNITVNSKSVMVTFKSPVNQDSSQRIIFFAKRF